MLAIPGLVVTVDDSLPARLDQPGNVGGPGLDPAPVLGRVGTDQLDLDHRDVDVCDAVEARRDILATRAWDRPQWQRRAAVT